MDIKHLILIAGIIPALSLASCDDNEPDNRVTTDLASIETGYDGNGIWEDCLNEDSKEIVCNGISFSRDVTVSEYGSFWSGFCLSRSSDMTDYSDGNWLDHQYDVMGGGGVSGKGTPFLIAYWNTMDSPESPSLKISLADGSAFEAESVYINNTTYGYYAMAKGTTFSKKFEQGDWCKAIFHGMAERINDKGEIEYYETGTVEYYLCDFRGSGESWKLPSAWEMVSLEPLNAGGNVSFIYLTMESSDTGVWGMNNPAYFAIDRLTIRLTK